MKTKKLLSILLALMMILSVVPFYASAAEALAVKNVSQWPTLSYKTDRELIYFGEKPADYLVINDDEIVLNAAGKQVAGHFEFIDPDEITTAADDAVRANIKFVPDDESTYTGFQRKRCPNVTFKVEKGTLKLVDEVNDPPITIGEYPSGTPITDIVITGGEVVNVLSDAADANKNIYNWHWQDTTLIVTESGYYNAIRSTAYFNDFVVPVYIEVESSIEVTTIVEAPTATIEYGTAWNEVVFEGGKVMAGDTEVSGTFTRTSTSTAKPAVGEHSLKVIFTPDDLEKYAPCEGYGTVTVTKGYYKLVNENGEEVTVPEFTMPYGTTLGMVPIQSLIKDRSLLTGADVANVYFPGHEKDEIIPVGTNTYNACIYPNHEDYSNYKRTDLQFVITIEPVVITTTAYWGISDKIGGKVSHEAKGTVDVFVDGELVGDDIKITRNKDWSFDYPIPATGDYTLKVVYNPIENDPHSMVDYETVVNVRMIRKIILPEDSRVTYKVNGDERTSIMRLGDTIELSTFGGDLFRGWKITDANGNIVDLGVADLMASDITFIMPDYDLYIEAQYEKEVVDDGNGGLDIDNIFGDLDLDNLTQGDSDNPIVNIFNNIIAFFKNIIATITELFRSIGDNT